MVAVRRPQRGSVHITVADECMVALLQRNHIHHPGQCVLTVNRRARPTHHFDAIHVLNRNGSHRGHRAECGIHFYAVDQEFYLGRREGFAHVAHQELILPVARHG